LLVKRLTAIGVPRPRVAAHGITAISPSGLCVTRKLLQQRVAIACRHVRSLGLSNTADKGANRCSSQYHARV
jgi:hypothetical protein